MMKKNTYKCVYGLALLGFTAASQASLTTVSTTIGGNDCSGYFGQGFESCIISVDGQDISPVIAKIAGNEGLTELNTALFPSITGDEFNVMYDTGTDGSGTWTYTPEGDDPAVRFWVAKGGSEGFEVFWNVDSSLAEGAGACTGDIWNFACVDAAVATTSGTWRTPTGQGLSHITFYDTAVVPVPAAVWLFGSGLLGLVGVARRKNHA